MSEEDRPDSEVAQEVLPDGKHPDDVADLDVEMSLGEHLSELRRRLLIAALSVLLFTIIGFIFIDPIIEFLRQPAPQDLPLHQFSPTEGLFTFMKVALMVGVAGAMPMLVYQIGAYVMPGLTRRERRYLYMLVPTSTFAFIVGMAFCYFVVLRFALGFLIGAESFVSEQVESVISVRFYIDFVARMMLALGIVFQTPIFIYFLSSIGLVDTQRLSRWRPFVIVICAIVAAVITPTPDPFNQALVAIPMYLLYEVGILLSRITGPVMRRRRSRSEE
jgi:sec-independent protein translocase protein TatC